MHKRHLLPWLGLLLFTIMWANSGAILIADETAECARCREHHRTTKVCRLVVEEKKVEVVCWGCKSEDFVVPGPSVPKSDHCMCVDCKSSAGTQTDVCSKPKKFVWTEWIPGCAKVFTKKKLMKMTVEKKVPSYKWIVEEVCDSCKHQTAGLSTSTAQLPPVPKGFEHLPRVIDQNVELAIVSAD